MINEWYRITREEIVHSNKAEEFDIDNSIPKQLEKNIQGLVLNLYNPLRRAFFKPIKINSGYRSEELNKLLKGAKNSQHTKAQALDITCKQCDKDELLKIALKQEFDQLIIEKYNDKTGSYSWLHISYDSTKDEQRGEVLIMRRKNNKTTYEKII